MKKEPPKPPRNNSNSNSGAGQNSAGPGSLQEVRNRLESFGYLNGRIERFYLSSISRSASLFFNRTLLSFRVGILAGTLAAILMTAGTLLFNQGLLSHKLDLFLLFLYFEVFFVLLFSILELGLIYVMSLFRFSGGRWIVFAGQAISFLIGLSFLAYFFYWGKTQYEYLRLLSTASLATMFLILILSCLFVARCVWLGFLVAFRESNLGSILPNWKRYGLEGLLSLIAVLILLPFVAGKDREQKEQVPVAVFGTSDKWIVIGIDGVSQENLQRFLNTEDLPNLRQAYAQSFIARLKVTEPIVPPVSWTTLATGVPPIEHGILMPEVRRWKGLTSWMQATPFELAMRSILVDTGLGQRQPVSGYLRKAKTFWEILSDYGIRVGVVNWWGSWPAQPIHGWNISERYYYKLFSRQPEQTETYPADLFTRYSALFKGKKKIEGPELDHFYAEIFRQQMKADSVRVAALYLPGFDILNYDFFHFRNMDPFTYTDRYKNHLRWLDRAIGQIHAESPSHHLLLIFDQGRSLKNEHSAVLIQYPHQASQQSPVEVSVLGITPLLLYTSGVPIGRSMDPDLIQALFSGSTDGTRGAVRFVDSYPRIDKQLEPGHLGEFNDLLVEQMKSLGYLQ